MISTRNMQVSQKLQEAGFSVVKITGGDKLGNEKGSSKTHIIDAEISESGDILTVEEMKLVTEVKKQEKPVAEKPAEAEAKAEVKTKAKAKKIKRGG